MDFNVIYLFLFPPVFGVLCDAVHVGLVLLPLLLPLSVVVLRLTRHDPLQNLLVLPSHPQQLPLSLLSVQTAEKSAEIS